MWKQCKHTCALLVELICFKGLKMNIIWKGSVWGRVLGCGEINSQMEVVLLTSQMFTVETRKSYALFFSYLLPDKSRRSKRKTSVKKNTLNPAWNERIEYSNLTIRDLEERVLEITVWDHDSSGHQFLGGVRCGLPQGDEYWHDCFGKEVDIWEGMMTYLGIYAEYTVPLRSTMASRKTQDVPMIIDVLNNEMNRAPDSPLPRAVCFNYCLNELFS